MSKKMTQACYITFSDGTKGEFVGEACVSQDSGKSIVKVGFSEPKELSMADFLQAYFSDWEAVKVPSLEE